ncbi:hypothetical protein V6N11_054492 [Hibiscus sabdariffa]|uniref:GDSL esterase/lipase n=1 Tax=Hibiscus sabdariffa TaxID=183260 RepID=A0ABR2S480_9ROSI
MAFKFLVCLAFFSMFLTYLVHGVPTTPSLPSFNISQGDLLKYLGLPNFGHILPALYVFGDSIIDAGNNNYLDTITRANYTPYGTDFGASQPTGRYTNGRTVVDFIGMSAAEVENTLTGVNYGSGSGGIQDLPPEPAHISGATAWVYIGSLDNNVIMQPNMLKSRNTYKSNTSCVEDINRRISYYNGLLPNMLAKLENSLKGSTFVVCDLYRVFADVYAQPAAYVVFAAPTQLGMAQEDVPKVVFPAWTEKPFSTSIHSTQPRWSTSYGSDVSCWRTPSVPRTIC